MTMTSGKPGTFETVRYEVDGPVCTITLDRPESANAQNTQLIDELDAAFDRADADDDVRVVVLAGEGKHFSAGHDLKELLTKGDEWAKLRDTPEGKLRHEQVMYFDRCVKIRDFRKPTIAAVQGACAAAGLMLACMCDLIVAADDAKFSNPVLRMTGAGVELLIEPWSSGPARPRSSCSAPRRSTRTTRSDSGSSTRPSPAPSSPRQREQWPTRSRWFRPSQRRP